MKRAKTSSSSSSSKDQLPKWATFHPISTSSISSISAIQSSYSSSCCDKISSSSSSSSLQNEHLIQIQNEEHVLRTKAYHYTSTQIVHKVFEDTLKKYVIKTIFHPVGRFMNQFQPCFYADDKDEIVTTNTNTNTNTTTNTNSNSNTTANTTIEEEKSEQTKSKKRKLQTLLDKEQFKKEIKHQIERKNIRYDPTILPIAIVNVPPSILDRKAILNTARYLFMSSSYCEDGKDCHDNIQDDCNVGNGFKPAVCVLSVKGKAGNHIVDLYFRSILNQCIQQENNQFHHDHQKNSSSSTLDAIFQWAQNTSKFNSILILIENPERIPTQTFNAFISTISSMRCVHGIPIGICLLSISKELIQKELLSNGIDFSSLHGEVGFILNEFSFVNTRLIVDEFLQQLHINPDPAYNLPILLSKKDVQALLYEYEKNHGSVVMFMNQLKIHLAHHFTTGARKRMIRDINAIHNDNKGMVVKKDHNDNPGRNSCVFFNKIQDLLEEKLIVELVIKLAIAVQRQLLLVQDDTDDNLEESDDAIGFDIIKAFLLRSHQFKLFLEKTLDFIRNISKKELMVMFGNFIDITDAFLSAHENSKIIVESAKRESDISQMKCVKEFTSFFAQSIVLLDRVTGDMEWDLREWIAENMCLVLSFKPFQGDSESILVPLVYLGRPNSKTTDQKIINVAPRHELALALSKTSAPHGLLIPDLTLDVKIAFDAFDSRLITLEEWFARFSEQVSQVQRDSPSINMTTMVHRFAFSLYQLMFCGLVVRSRRKDNLFEKGALVWASTTY